MGEHVSGIVVMREGANALDVIRGVKAKLQEIEPGLPAGVGVEIVYDRSVFIESALRGLRNTLLEIMLVVAVVILIFLGDFASAMIPIVTAPLTILIALAIFRPLGISLNILSIGGLALAVGTLVDASIVVVEQVHKKLELQTGPGVHRAIRAALHEVSGPAFFALSGHWRGVSSDSCPRWTGGAAVRTAGLGQDDRHPDRRDSRRDA